MDQFRPESPGPPGPAPPPPPPPGDARPRSRAALWALVLGVLPLVLPGLVLGVLGIRDTADRRCRGRELAIIGIAASLLWALAIGLVAVGVSTDAFEDPERDAAGALVESGSLDATDLRAGDCFDLPRDDDVLDVDAGPCTTSHDAQVIGVLGLGGSDFPGDDEVSDRAERTCLPAFDRALERAARAGVTVPSGEPTWFVPTDESWTYRGDRTITCIARWRRAVSTGIPRP